MADWPELLPDLLIDIASCITFLPDQINFAGVCQSWRSAATTLPNFILSPPRFPLLLLAERSETEESGDWEVDEENSAADHRQLFILPSNLSPIWLPEARKRHCLSTNGWILTIGEDNNDVNLLNPLTRQQVILPKLDTFSATNNGCLCDWCTDDDSPYDNFHIIHLYKGHERGDQHFVRKVVLSCDPLSEEEDCYMMVIWGDTCRLGFCKLGDVSWTDVSGWTGRIDDITYHNRLLYGVCTEYGNGIGGRIIVCDLHHSNPKISVVVDLPISVVVVDLPMDFDHSTMYVLSGFDEKKLLMVLRMRVLVINIEHNTVYSRYETSGFEVFELNLEDCKWSKLESLVDKAIFVGYNSSLWIEADGSAVKPNCIYFSDDVYKTYLRYSGAIGGGKDMGVFHLPDGIIEPHFKGESCSMVSPPIWVEPIYY